MKILLKKIIIRKLIYFLENQYFSIRSFQDDYESDNQNEFKGRQVYHKCLEDEYLIDENGKIRSNKDDQLNLEYSPIPPINDYLYIPQLFRSKYEIWIWKVDRRNVAKIKQSYVSPEVSIFKLLQFLFDILIVTS